MAVFDNTKMFTTLEKFGLICISIVGFQLVRCLFRAIYNNFLAVKLGINAVCLKELGKWAVVTGATDGLGKAYAHAFAKKGFNIVLISRTQSKLDSVAQEIESKFNRETKTVAVDFSEGEKIYHVIEKQLSGLEIGILINNVGVSYSYPEYFLDVQEKDNLYASIINCNILSVTNMCKMVMPGMVERRRGVVVNVASTAALVPSPLLTVYSASKSYVQKFSEDLATEYSKHGVTIQCVLPGYVATKMSKIRRSTWMAPTPEQYVKEALQTLGVHQHTTGYFPHTLLVGVLHTLDWFSPRLSRWLVMRTMENIRRRALKHKSANTS